MYWFGFGNVQHVREVALQMLLVGRDRARALVPARESSR